MPVDPLTNPDVSKPAARRQGGRFAPRVTVAVIVPHPDDADLVLSARRYLFVEEWVQGARVVNQPAGHLDPDESLEHAAVRETLEETAWQVELEALVAVHQYQTRDQAFVRFCFAAKALQQHSRPLDQGIIRSLWLKPEELAQHTLRSPMVPQGLTLYLEGHRHDLALLRAQEHSERR
jgi:ADP-ribose pyrophosphatase YjhB (NUDIX family)